MEMGVEIMLSLDYISDVVVGVLVWARGCWFMTYLLSDILCVPNFLMKVQSWNWNRIFKYDFTQRNPTQINKKPKHTQSLVASYQKKNDGNILCSEWTFDWVNWLIFGGHGSCFIITCNLTAVHTTEKPANKWVLSLNFKCVHKSRCGWNTTEKHWKYY